MIRLYCPECSEYLEGGDGECHDCSCGWKQPVDDQCFSGELEALKAENEAQAKRIEEVKTFLAACAEDSMSRNNRQQLAGELLDMLNGDSK